MTSEARTHTWCAWAAFDNGNTLMEPSISLQELQKHNKVDDAWIVISGKVLLLKVLLTINLFNCKMLIFAYGRKQSNCLTSDACQ